MCAALAFLPCACLEAHPDYIEDEGGAAHGTEGTPSDPSTDADETTATDSGAGSSNGAGDGSGSETGEAGGSSGTSDGGASGSANTTSTATTDVATSATGSNTVGGHLIFVTSQTYNGNLGGVAGADAKCQDVADVAGLDGTWRAIVSAPGDDVADRLVFTGPITNMAGEDVAMDGAQLWSETLSAAPRFDENASPVAVETWTGSAGDGTLHAENCVGFTSDGGKGRRGAVEGTNYGWLSVGWRGCGWLLHLYCVSQ